MRKLVLNKEILRSLDDMTLENVVGGERHGGVTTVGGNCSPITQCNTMCRRLPGLD